MTSSKTPTMMLDELADAAWNSSPTCRRVPFILMHRRGCRHSGSQRAVAGTFRPVLNKLARLDRQAVLETLADIEDAGDVPVQDKIIEGLMHRFGLCPVSPPMAQLENAARRDPALGLRLIDCWFMPCACCCGWRVTTSQGCGARPAFAACGVAMLVARTWQTDDTDLSTTLKDIDRRLATAEEWGRTLRVLDGDSRGRADGRRTP